MQNGRSGESSSLSAAFQRILQSNLMRVTEASHAREVDEEDVLQDITDLFPQPPRELIMTSSTPTTSTNNNNNAVGVEISEGTSLPSSSASPGIPKGLEEYKCPICWDVLISAAAANCNYKHRFCSFCIEKWMFRSRSTCPVCRTSITTAESLPLFDLQIKKIYETLSKEIQDKRVVALAERATAITTELEERLNPQPASDLESFDEDPWNNNHLIIIN